MALTKTEIANSISEEIPRPKAKVNEIVELLLEIMKRSMETGEDILISGFGKFCIKDEGKRRGRNPATGEDMMLEARRIVTFDCAGNLRGQWGIGYTVFCVSTSYGRF